jgi:type III secretory pathway component EscV
VRRPRISSDVLLAAAVALGVAILILPLPTAVIDALLSAQLAAAVVMLLIATGSSQPSRLAGFPVALLVLTLLRLALNVATTRAILARGEAGQVVAAFGDAVVGGDLVVGLVVFGVLTLAQYLVIAKGAERIAEVSARFALDALPGRLAGIEAEMRAGQLQAESARSRRQALARTSGLYGAMDGVMRFVRGDAIAGLCIVGVNIIGGLALGIGRQGLALEEALATYTVLTVGDGLAAQLPAVLQTAAAALLATRLASPGEGPRTALVDARPLYGTAALFAALAVLPGLPAVPMLAVAGSLGLAGRLRRERLPPFEPTPDPAEAATVPLTLVVHPMAVTACARSTCPAWSPTPSTASCTTTACTCPRRGW